MTKAVKIVKSSPSLWRDFFQNRVYSGGWVFSSSRARASEWGEPSVSSFVVFKQVEHFPPKCPHFYRHGKKEACEARA